MGKNRLDAFIHGLIAVIANLDIYKLQCGNDPSFRSRTYMIGT
jgi:hypothetical protein